MKRMLLLLTAVALLTGPAVRAEKKADAKPKPAGARRMARGKMPLLPPRAVEELKLTADQQAKLDELDAKWAKERDEWHASHLEQNTKLREEMKAARVAEDESKIKELRVQVREQNAPLMELRKKYADQVRSILTDEQKSSLAEMQAKRRDRMKKRGHQGGGKDKE